MPQSLERSWVRKARCGFHVVRGDVARIQVGRRLSIQDGAVIHGTFGQSQTVLEDDVSIGHNAIVHGAHVKHSALIGMGSVADHVTVGEGAVVAAGAVVLAGTTIEDGELGQGCRQNVAQVSDSLREHLSQTAARYVEYAGWFQGDGAPGK